MDIVPVEIIQRKILIIRGRRVMLDRDLAELYEVETRALNQAVKRNIERFPEDFMFQLTRDEIMRISQIVISSRANALCAIYRTHPPFNPSPPGRETKKFPLPWRERARVRGGNSL